MEDIPCPRKKHLQVPCYLLSPSHILIGALSLLMNGVSLTLGGFSLHLETMDP